MVTRRLWTAALTCGLTAALASSGSAVAAAVVASPTTPAATGTAAGAVAPVAWAPCGEAAPEFECATYAVPRDHDDPAGAALEIALTRLPASDAAGRVGSLFVNPGGPGGSGVAFAQQAGAALRDLTAGRLDVVGFDPRGVGASTPVQCFTSPEEALAFDLDADDVVPDTPEELTERVVRTSAFTELCGRRNPDLLPHISTGDVARDLDLLRAAVGDEQLTYYGLSYGTVLGSTYANLFPDRVRALALDGAIDPEAYTDDFTTFLTGSLRDSDEALEGFLGTCEAAGPDLCALADGDPGAVVREVLGGLREQPLPALDAAVPGVVTEEEATRLLFNLLYSPAVWPQLAAALDVAATGDGSALRDLALLFVTEDPDGYDNAFDAQLATLCNDTGDDGDPLRWYEGTDAASEASELFAPVLSYSIGLPCATWPVDAASRYAGPWDAPTANPLLVIGATADPITPLASAQRLDELLASSRLLVHDGYGHTSLSDPSTCSLQALSAYLVDLALPPEGTTCAADAQPFQAPPPAAAPRHSGSLLSPGAL